MTNNSKIGLGVGMVAVFATFVIASYGPQTNKVASLNSYNNSAAALSTPTAQENISSTKTSSSSVSVQPTPCLALQFSPLPLSSYNLLEGANPYILYKFRVKNPNTNQNCTENVTLIDFVVLSKNGTIPFHKTFLVDAASGAVLSNAAAFNTGFFNQQTLTLGGSLTSPMFSVAPSQSKDIILRADYIRNTNINETPSSLGQNPVIDYFMVGISRASAFDAFGSPLMNISPLNMFYKPLSIN